VKPFFDLVPADWGGRDRGCLHLYVLPNRQVRDMAVAYQQVFDQRGIDGLSRQPADHLHITVQKLLVWRHDLADEQVKALADTLRIHVARVPAWTAQVGPALVAGTSIGLDVTPDQPWQQLRQAVRAAVTESLGEQALPRDGGAGRPHISLGYGLTDFDIDPHLAAINGLRLGRADLTIDRVVLVAVDQDRTAGAYTWPTPLAELPLAAAGPGRG